MHAVNLDLALETTMHLPQTVIRVISRINFILKMMMKPSRSSFSVGVGMSLLLNHWLAIRGGLEFYALNFV